MQVVFHCPFTQRNKCEDCRKKYSYKIDAVEFFCLKSYNEYRYKLTNRKVKRIEEETNRKAVKHVKRKRKNKRKSVSRISKNVRKKRVHRNVKKIKKKTKKKKKKQKLYDKFIIDFTATRIRYPEERNKANADLESFSRIINTASKMTVRSFIKRIAPDIVEYEMSVFEKISKDTEDAITWGDWIIHYKHFEEKRYSEY